MRFVDASAFLAQNRRPYPPLSRKEGGFDHAEFEIIAAGLPLGLDPDAAFEEGRFLVPSSGSLTFLSGGIVEARNAAGELFGFDRTLWLSTSSARAIAQAAVDFGQDDDITVVTLTRLAEVHMGIQK